MPRQGKNYSINGKSAQFLISSKKWLVKINDKEYHFKNVIELVKHFPEFLKVDRIAYMVKHKENIQRPVAKEKSPRMVQNPKKNQLQKTERCYNCSGSGVNISGFKCPNCKGKGEIIITATLY